MCFFFLFIYLFFNAQAFTKRQYQRTVHDNIKNIIINSIGWFHHYHRIGELGVVDLPTLIRVDEIHE